MLTTMYRAFIVCKKKTSLIIVTFSEKLAYEQKNFFFKLGTQFDIQLLRRK